MGSHMWQCPKQGWNAVPSSLVFLIASQQTILNLSNFFRHFLFSPPAPTLNMTKLPELGHWGRDISGMWDFLCFCLCVSFFPSPFPSPSHPFFSSLSLWSSFSLWTENKTGKADFLFNLLFPWLCSERKGMIKWVPDLLLPLFLHPTSFSKVWQFQRETYRLFSYRQCSFRQILTSLSFTLSILPKPVYFLSFQFEKLEREGPHSDGFRIGPEQDVSKGNQNLASLHFSKDGNAFLGLGLLGNDPRVAFCRSFFSFVLLCSCPDVPCVFILLPGFLGPHFSASAFPSLLLTNEEAGCSLHCGRSPASL